MISIAYRVDLADVANKLKSLLGASDVDCSKRPDVTVVVGGDGTLLETIHRYPCVLDSLVVHIGGGRINFYRSVRIGEMKLEEIAKRVLSSEFNVVELPTIDAGCTAVNEVVIRNVDYRKLLSFKIVGGTQIVSGRADGVIVATPQGSTGYAISTWGPIVDYRLAAFVISFLAPYTLHLRPLVVPQEPLEVLTAQEAELTCDGYDVQRGRSFHIRRGGRNLKLVVFGEYDFYERVSARLLSQ
ncbi:MAG: NAD(+)/NADH kinase [Thermoproteus sp.]